MARWISTLVMLVFAVTALAGCLGDDSAPASDPNAAFVDPALRDPLTEPVYEILGHFHHKFVGTTGTQLYVDYYLPEVPADVKVPVILVFTPYQSADIDDLNEDLAGMTGDPADFAYSPNLVKYFVPRGYAVAFADVRGNHQAGGCIDQTGPEQWQDGYDYVEWLGTQDWSNGKVGMYGVSYDAETQFTTAMLAPPHLTTIVPIASVSNQYEWNFYDGVPYSGQPFFGMFGYFTGSAMPSYDPMDLAKYPEKLTCQAEAMGAGVDFSGDYTTFWQERDYRPMAKDIEASVLHVHGLADWNVRPIHIDPLFNDIVSEKRGIFGLWHHATPDREDWQTILHAWYDHWLLDRHTGIMEILPPVLIEDDTGAWHAIDSFPPKQQDWLVLGLSADGTLTEPGVAQEGTFVLVDHREENFLIGQDAAADAQARVSGGVQEIVFTYTVPEDMHLVGRPEVRFNASTSEVSTHWAVRLSIEGDARCAYEFRDNDFGQSVCINTGYRDSRHRDGIDKPSDVTPGTPYALRIPMYPQYDVVPAGSVLRLHIANHDDEVTQDDTGAENTVFVGGPSATLWLPLAPLTTPLPADQLPSIFPGYLAP